MTCFGLKVNDRTWQNDKDRKFCSEEDAMDNVGDSGDEDLFEPAVTGWRWKLKYDESVIEPASTNWKWKSKYDASVKVCLNQLPRAEGLVNFVHNPIHWDPLPGNVTLISVTVFTKIIWEGERLWCLILDKFG